MSTNRYGPNYGNVLEQNRTPEMLKRMWFNGTRPDPRDHYHTNENSPERRRRRIVSMGIDLEVSSIAVYLQEERVRLSRRHKCRPVSLLEESRCVELAAVIRKGAVENPGAFFDNQGTRLREGDMLLATREEWVLFFTLAGWPPRVAEKLAPAADEERRAA